MLVARTHFKAAMLEAESDHSSIMTPWTGDLGVTMGLTTNGADAGQSSRS